MRVRTLPALLLVVLAGTAEAASYRRADGARIDAKVLDAPGCAPLAIISHGLGGNANGNGGLAEALNAVGFRVVVPSHAESGPRVLFSALSGGKQALDRLASDPGLLRLRLADITAILDTETRRCALPFKVLAGHSMGARTTTIEAGAVTSSGLRGQDRFDAYIAVSPLGEGTSFAPAGAYAPIAKPVLMITGTEDRSVEGGAETRLSAFRGLSPGRKRLAILAGADHMELGGRGGGPVPALVGIVAAEFVRQLRPGPWGPSRGFPGAVIREK